MSLVYSGGSFPLLVLSQATQIAIFKSAPIDISIPLEMEVVDVYTYPRQPLRSHVFAKASGFQGYDALTVREGQLVGRRIYPAQLGVALRVAGEGEYRFDASH